MEVSFFLPVEGRWGLLIGAVSVVDYLQAYYEDFSRLKDSLIVLSLVVSDF